MHLHRLGSLTLASSNRLPEVPQVAGEAGVADWTFRLCAARPARKAGPWLRHLSLPDGRRWLSIARSDGDYLLRFHRLADFRLSLESQTIVGVPRPRTTAATVRHLLLDQVLPMVVARGRTFALHASAIRGRRGIVAFLGPAGAGKSTLAVALARRGWTLIGDDCLLVEIARGEVRARATYASARLHADSLRAIEGVWRASGPAVAQYTRKRRIDPAAAGLRIGAVGTRSKIEKLYVLAPDARRSADRPRVVQLSSRAAMLELLRFTFHLDLFDRRAVASRFDLAALAAERIAACRLSFRHDFSGLEMLRACVEADVTG
jgi:hypothetical protein